MTASTKGLRDLLDRVRGIFERNQEEAVAAGIAAALLSVVRRVGSLWGRSYVGVFSAGQTYDRDDGWLQWRLGATEQHCTDCLHLDGQIHQSSTWRAAGIQPQSPDLECGGWNCDCRLVPLPASYDGGDVGRI